MSTTLWECVADALFLATLNLGNSNVQFKDLAEVGATGRFIPPPLACRGLTMSSRTLNGCIVYYQRRGYHSVSFTVRVFLGPKVANGQKPDTPLFHFCSRFYNYFKETIRFWGVNRFGELYANLINSQNTFY